MEWTTDTCEENDKSVARNLSAPQMCVYRRLRMKDEGDMRGRKVATENV